MESKPRRTDDELSLILSKLKSGQLNFCKWFNSERAESTESSYENKIIFNSENTSLALQVCETIVGLLKEAVQTDTTNKRRRIISELSRPSLSIVQRIFHASKIKKTDNGDLRFLRAVCDVYYYLDREEEEAAFLLRSAEEFEISFNADTEWFFERLIELEKCFNGLERLKFCRALNATYRTSRFQFYRTDDVFSINKRVKTAFGKIPVYYKTADKQGRFINFSEFMEVEFKEMGVDCIIFVGTESVEIYESNDKVNSLTDEKQRNVLLYLLESKLVTGASTQELGSYLGIDKLKIKTIVSDIRDRLPKNILNKQDGKRDRYEINPAKNIIYIRPSFKKPGPARKLTK